MSYDPILLIFVAGVLSGVNLAILVFLTPDLLNALRSIKKQLRRQKHGLWKW